MKKILLSMIAVICMSVSTVAQSHSDRITFGMGLLYESPESFWRNYNTWGIGAAYKPCVVRGRNNYGNLRIGASVGSNTDKFLGGFHVGYEHNFALRKGWVMYVQAKCDLMVPDRKDLFREGIVLGFKIPTLK